MEDEANDGSVVNWDLGTALALLRTVAGWTQEDLAKASGMRGSSISDYENGKILPGLKTLRRMMNAQGLPLSAMELALTFIEVLKNERSFPNMKSTGVSAAPPFSRLYKDTADFRREVEEVAAIAGNVVSRMVRLQFSVACQAAGGTPSGPADSALTDEGDGKTA